MNNQFFLFARQSSESENQVVEQNQIVVDENRKQYVVIKIYKLQNREGYQYELLNPTDLTSFRAQFIKPLSQKFGIGFYYDDKNPEFKTVEEVTKLLAKAQVKKQIEAEKQAYIDAENEKLKNIGREWFNINLPIDAKSMIVAYKETCDFNPYLDYQNYSKSDYQILGFSISNRNNVKELRKFANLFDGTKYLEKEDKDSNDVHNYDKYDFYIGYHNDWMIKKIVIQDRANFIETWAITAGDSENIHVSKKEENDTTLSSFESIDVSHLNLEIVEYSEKSYALFGDTKPIKDILNDKSGLNGRFNPQLTHNGQKKAGWIFQKSKINLLKKLLGVN